MAKMMDMRNEADESTMPMTGDDGQMQYPWGLSLCINEDQAEKLGITAIKSGTQVSINAMAVVTRATQSLSSEGTDVSFTLQITDMGIAQKGVMRDAAKKLYNKA